MLAGLANRLWLRPCVATNSDGLGPRFCGRPSGTANNLGFSAHSAILLSIASRNGEGMDAEALVSPGVTTRPAALSEDTLRVFLRLHS